LAIISFETSFKSVVTVDYLHHSSLSPRRNQDTPKNVMNIAQTSTGIEYPVQKRY